MGRGLFEKVLAFPFAGRQRALAKNRVQLNQADFVSSVARSGGDAEAAELVYSHLQDWIYDDDFTPYPDDSLGSVFGIAEEELDEDIILAVVVKLGLPVPSRQAMAAFGSMDTATDIARFSLQLRSGKTR